MRRLMTAAVLISGCGGGGESGEGTSNSIQTSFSVNAAVVGSGFQNVLKGITVAVDEANRRAYVAGIVTDQIGVVDLDSGALTRTYSLPHFGFTVRALAFDATHRRLWVVSTKGDRIWLTDPDQGTTILEVDTSAETAAGSLDYPVMSQAVDPARQRLYVARVDGDSRVNVYDSSGVKMGEILADRTIVALRWDAAHDELVALSSPPGGTWQILVLPQGSESGMTALSRPAALQTGSATKLALDAGGDRYFAAGSALWSLDRSGSGLWSTSLTPSTAEAVEALGSEVAVLHKYGPSSQSDLYFSRMDTYQLTDGALLATRKSRFESKHMAACASAGLYVVGNGGDASVTLFAPGTSSGTTLKVGSSAEDVLLTPDGTRVLALNRLGGSQLVEFDLATGAARAVEAGYWPMKMAARAADDRLYVLSHFESKLTVLRMSDLSAIGTIPFNLPASTTDTVADLAADPDGKLLAALVCEQGKVAVVGGASGSILALTSLAGSSLYAGPGRMRGAVDAEGSRVFVYLADDKKIYRMDGSAGYGVALSAAVSPSAEAKSAYAIGGVHYSPLLHRLFVMDQIVDPDSFQTLGSLSGIHRVVGEEAGVLYAQRRDAEGNEYLVTLDASTLTVTRETYLQTAEIMGSYVSFDLERGRMAVTNPAASTVAITDPR